MISFFQLSLPIFAVIGVGWAATRTRLVAQGALDALNAFSFRFALPALLLRLIAEQPLRQSFNPAFYIGCLASGAIIVGTDRRTFAVISLWRKFGGLHARAATFVYVVPLPNIFLTRLFSKLRLKRKDFQEILRLPWAQEVPSSNLGAPTKTSRMFSLVYRIALFVQNSTVEFRQTGVLNSQVV
jgi:hypothetical protein